MAVQNKIENGVGVKLKKVLSDRLVTGCLCLLVGLCVGWVAKGMFLDNSETKIDAENIRINRTMLASKTDYDGIWAGDKDNLFEVYLPGEELDDRNYNSEAVTAFRSDADGGLVMKAFGVYRSKVKLDIEIEDDAYGIIDLVMDYVVQDVGNVCMAGNPVGSYDVDFIELDDGRTAMFVQGEVSMTQVFQEQKGDRESYEEENVYKLIVYVTLEKGYPVAIWTCYDRFDYFAGEEAPRQIEEIVYTLWQTKFTADLPQYETVPTYMDENRVVHVDEKWLEERNRKEVAYGEDGTVLPEAPVSGTAMQIREAEGNPKGDSKAITLKEEGGN